jgi:hypothetical protein
LMSDSPNFDLRLPNFDLRLPNFDLRLPKLFPGSHMFAV